MSNEGATSASPDADPRERLQKVMARCGIASRRVCEDMIVAGQVTINGTVATLGDKVDAMTDVVAIDGVELSVIPDLVVYLLNKPAGVLSTADDPQGRPTVVELVPADVRVFPVGRLDMDTEGLLLLTNDGALTHRLPIPALALRRSTWPKLRVMFRRENFERYGKVSTSKMVEHPQPKLHHPPPGMVKLVIHEGRNRQVRRMCDAVGHPVAATGENTYWSNQRRQTKARYLAQANEVRGP